MKASWYAGGTGYETFILSGDIGGTNTGIALVGKRHKEFAILAKFLFQTQTIVSFTDVVQQVLLEIESNDPSLKPSYCCMSGAGPVVGNSCTLTNGGLRIDGDEISSMLGLKTLVINDFMAISYGIPLLDVDNKEQLTPIPHTDGSLPRPKGTVKASVGAGTGLGVGYLAEIGGRTVAFPSEGGHAGFPPFDEETLALWNYMHKKIGRAPGSELFVSGQGITNIFHFFEDEKRITRMSVAGEIVKAPEAERPALVARYAQDDELCMRIMELFVRMYGKVASNAAIHFLPTAGLYLGGGIVTKNEEFFLRDHCFMKSFEENYKEGIRKVLKEIPVYIIKDYSISLYGAAHAISSILGV